MYLELGDERPEGVIGIAEGVNIDTTPDGKLVGIEILKALEKMDIKTVLSYKLELDKKIVAQKIA